MAVVCRVVALAAVLACVGCGGRVDTAGSGDGGSVAYGDAASDHDPWPSSPLGPCVPGHPYGEPGSCTFISDGLCYETKQAACNCACPKDHDSVCTSDFPDPNGPPAEVVCG